MMKLRYLLMAFCCLFTIVYPVISVADSSTDQTPPTYFTSFNQVGAPSGLLCDLMESPTIFNHKPSFSWEFYAHRKGVMQEAYQVLVSDDLRQLDNGIGNIWDSGKVLSASSTGIPFNGSALKPNTTYFWKVKVWINGKEVSPYAKAASFVTAPTLSTYQNPAYRLQVTEQKPTALKTINSTYQADFGKAAFAQLKLQLTSKTGGDTVNIHLGEILDAKGHVDRRPPGKIRYAKYVLVLEKGTHTYNVAIRKDAFNTRPAAIKMPDYIGEVMPYRYCEVEGYALPLNKEALTRLMVHYKFDEAAAHFESSDSTLNAIWELCKYSIKATSFLGIYVDGDRERIPYEADAYINQLSHYAVDKEFTMARNSHEYLINNPTWPTEWNLQSVLLAWNDYLYTGDIRSISHYYQDLQAKTLISLSDSTGLISTLNGKLTQAVKTSIHLKDDNLRDIVDWPRNTETDSFVFTKYNSVVNAFHYRTLIIMQQIATDLGKTADAAMYQKKAADVKKAFYKMFFDPNRKIFVDGQGTDHASLHANAFALALGLVDPAHNPSVTAHIKSRGMACSVYGSQFLLDGIYDAGDADYGLSLLTSKTDRSWFNMIRVGSTITLEAWDNKYKPNQDWNHAWGAAPANIISRKLMGVEPIKPGWSSFLIKPQIGSLSHASITIPTIKGQIKVACKQTAEVFDMDVMVPGNSVAQLHLPLKSANKYTVLLNGKPVKTSSAGQAIIIDNLGAGSYQVKLTYQD
jgi:alpha-L-rhamnosidase